MRRMDRVIVKLEGLEKDVSGIKHSVSNLEDEVSGIKRSVSNLGGEISEIKSDVRVIKGQFGDVAVMAIEDNKRITKLEKEVEDLQSNIH